jgi:hypothetical protein
MAKSSRSPADYPTWRMAADASICLTAPEAAALELVAQLPFAPLAYIAPFARTSDRSTLYRRIAHLVERHLVATFDGPPHGRCRPRQLLLITNRGLAVLAWRHAVDSGELVRRWGLSHSATAALLRQLPAVLRVYELLALLPASRVGWKARFLSWHGPWVSTGSTCWAGGVRLPHCVLEWQSDREQTQVGRYALVADTGGLPPLALRSRLARLAQMQLRTGTPAPVAAIATTSHRRVEAWSAMLASVANTRRGGYLESCIDTWDAWRSGRVAICADRTLCVGEPVRSTDDLPAIRRTVSTMVPRPSADRPQASARRNRGVEHPHRRASRTRHNRPPPLPADVFIRRCSGGQPPACSVVAE